MGEVTAPRSSPPARDPRRPFAPSPFSRLARTHAAGISGDALFAVALAGSVFFDLDFNSARWRVALYLVLTIAPFAVAAPLIGPALDRIKGGRRWVVVASMALRAVLCFLVIRHLNSLLFYPEAFLMLVLGKTYTISKSAIVPTTVGSDAELVEANSKLTVLAAIAVVAAVVPGGLLLKLGGPEWSLALALVAFVVATGFAVQLPQVTVAVEPPDEAERMELRSAAIFLASVAMGLIRGIVGFLVFMLAFSFKNEGAPTWELGIAAGAAQLGFFLGAVAAPQLRRLLTEERIILGSLGFIAAAGVVCWGLGGLAGAAVLAMAVGATSSAAKQAFDAIVQRDAPDANRGRSFARFETRFQLYWVVGALIPIVITIPRGWGFLLVAIVATGTIVWYVVGLWRMRNGHVPARRRGWRLPHRPTDPPPAPAAGADPTLVVAPAGVPAAAMPPPPPGARRWARPATDRPLDWEPPPGFVARPLADETVAGATEATSLPPSSEKAQTATDGSVVQPELPLEPAAEDETLEYPEPPWRDG